MSFLLNLIFPKRCYGCQSPGCYLCSDCASRLIPKSIVPPQASSPVESSLSLFPYRGFLKTMITDLKYSFITDLVPDLVAPMSRCLQSDFPHLVDYWRQNHYFLIPIPLHPRRFNWRGFNQAELLAAALAPRLHLPYCSDLLLRPRSSSPQAGLSRSSRSANIAGSFALNPNRLPFPSANVILIDDVATTGSTLAAAASVLRLTNFTSIWGLTLVGGH